LDSFKFRGVIKFGEGLVLSKKTSRPSLTRVLALGFIASAIYLADRNPVGNLWLSIFMAGCGVLLQIIAHLKD
jgi:hypothetical protein